MFPTNSALSFSSSKHLAECHKETQTSSTTVKDSSTSSQPSTSDKGSITVFEFNEILQDPQKPHDITIIKDVFSEEIHDYDSDSQSDETKSNRYKYCREVIKPYLKDYPLDCPISDEQLIRDALIAAHQDFPDYQPCFEIYDHQHVTDKTDTDKSDSIEKSSSLLSTENIPQSTKSCADNKNKKSKSSQSNNRKDTSPAEGSIKSHKCKSKRDKHKISDSETSIKGPIKVYRRKSKSITNSEDSSYNSLKSKMSEDKTCLSNKQAPSNASDHDACPPKPRDPRCPTKERHTSIENNGNQGSSKSPLGLPSACKNRTTEGLSTCKNTPSVGSCKNEPDAEGSSTNKNKDDNPCHRLKMSDSIGKLSLTDVDKPKSMPEARSETIGTIKTAVEDFFGKVYQTTKDAVTLIKTESAKQIDNLTKKETKDSNCKLPPRNVSDDRDSKNVETNNFQFFRIIENNDNSSHDTKESSGHGLSKTAEMVVSKILNKVDSTISMLSSHVDFEKVTNLIKVKNEASSRFDVTHDEAAASNTKMSVGNSMFTTIKSKIMSMFSENEMQRVVPRKSNDSTNSQDEDNAFNSIGRY